MNQAYKAMVDYLLDIWEKSVRQKQFFMKDIFSFKSYLNHILVSFFALGIHPRALCKLLKFSTSEWHPHLLIYILIAKQMECPRMHIAFFTEGTEGPSAS